MANHQSHCKATAAVCLKNLVKNYSSYFLYRDLYVVFPQEFELRKLARSEGRRYCNPVVLTYQAERMPEQIRLNVSRSRSQYDSVDTLVYGGPLH